MLFVCLSMETTSINDLHTCSVGILARYRVQKIPTLFRRVLALICNHYFVCSDFLPVFFFWCFFFSVRNVVRQLVFILLYFLNQLCVGYNAAMMCYHIAPFYILFVYKIYLTFYRIAPSTSEVISKMQLLDVFKDTKVST